LVSKFFLLENQTRRLFLPTNNQKELFMEIEIESGDVKITRSAAWVSLNPQFDYGDPRGARFVRGDENDRYNFPNREVIPNIARTAEFNFGVRAISTDLHYHRENPAEVAEFAEYGDHCIKGTQGIKVLEPISSALAKLDCLKMKKGENPFVIGNSIGMSDEFPALIENLREKNISKIFICGFPFGAVAESAIDLAKQHLYNSQAKIYLILDAIRADPPPRKNPKRMREFIGEIYGIKFIFADQLK
jgi:nicotinamidase-related amidase